MKNMQRGYLKIVAAIILSAISILPSLSQTSSFRLRTADSLFNAKRYVQSFDHYHEMLQQKQYTPAMLLKMAFIQEGLAHIGQSMYYLNLYFLATHDKTALDKMNELATKHNLIGYETSETDHFLSLYQENYIAITLVLALLMVFICALIFYTRVQLKRRPFVSFIFLVITAIGVSTHLFYKSQSEISIVTNPATYVMSGPSAAAPVVEIIGDGHRVLVKGKKDVWLKIEWNGTIAYVKENTLQPIQL